MTTYCHDPRHDEPCPLPCAACADECSPGDDMTCSRCGGHFERREGVDSPEPTCPWCLVESRFNA